MKKLKEIILEAEENKVAVGHFNFSNIEGFWAIFNSARKLNLPIIMGLSEGERRFVGARQAVALVRSLREEFDYPVYINADHSYSYNAVKEAIDAQFDAVIFDGTKLSLEENIEMTKKCVKYAKSLNPDILVEGELGYIGSSSKVLDEIPEGAEIKEEDLVKPEEAKEFVSKTGVDLLAPAVGNLHGMLKHAKNPRIAVSLINDIRKEAGVPLVLHGGSGIEDYDFVEAIKAGISIVHINTQLRLTYKNAVIDSFNKQRDEVAPYRLMKPVVETMEKMVEERLRLFNNL
jgi:fructose-bisphosphate aldolase class II